MGLDIGLGLWTFQSTALHPRPVARDYREFPAVARRAEALGYRHLWLGEHRFWYDAWCPAPLMPIAAASAVTSRLRFGTAMALLPQHDPRRLAATAQAVRRIAAGRLEFGVGLGHRDAEFDGLGIARPSRGERMDRGLELLLQEPTSLRREEVWVGGMAPRALERIGRYGLSALLPQTLDEDGTRRAVDLLHQAAHAAGGKPGRIGMLKDVWIDDSGARAREWFLPRLRRHYREEAGAWWVLGGNSHGFGASAALDRQVDRATSAAVVGDPEEVAERLGAVADAGIDTVVVRLNFDFVSPQRLDAGMTLFAESVLGVLSAPLSQAAVS